jgi:hypothetical protein
MSSRLGLAAVIAFMMLGCAPKEQATQTGAGSGKRPIHEGQTP